MPRSDFREGNEARREMEQRAWSGFEWRRGAGRGEQVRKGRGCWGAGPAGSSEDGPLSVLGAAQPPELGFLNFPVLYNGGQSTGLAVPAPKLTSVSPQACYIHLLSLRYNLPFQLQSCPGDRNQMQVNHIKRDSLK